jgi:hypothetical protein
MGRYATFSTGFSYKFAFARQSSSDIEEFGGYLYKRFEEDADNLEYFIELYCNDINIAELTDNEIDDFNNIWKIIKNDNSYPYYDLNNIIHKYNLSNNFWIKCVGNIYYTSEIRWTDRDEVLNKLKELNDNRCDYVLDNMKNFTYNTKGTDKLELWLDSKYLEESENINEDEEIKYYKFKLGILIYHQLLYRKELICEYEC